MNRLAFSIVAGLLTSLSFAAPVRAEDKKEAPVVPPRKGERETIKLFNGKDLDGWEGMQQNADKAKNVGKQHDWNRMDILAQGNRIRFVLNGVLISDWREPMPDRIKEAPIGLQLHSNKVPQEVQFKNLVLETFPEDKLTTLDGGKP